MSKFTFVELKDAAGNIYRVNPHLVRYLFAAVNNQKFTSIYFDSNEHVLAVEVDVATVAKKLAEAT
jgi:hypothetical protein